ncbi:hypothetical protein IMY05_C2998003600 [Salix suchowensis]|nr:hypothetical protein IMY05_C2998003600 [Salix suchowensis]
MASTTSKNTEYKRLKRVILSVFYWRDHNLQVLYHDLYPCQLQCPYGPDSDEIKPFFCFHLEIVRGSSALNSDTRTCYYHAKTSSC